MGFQMSYLKPEKMIFLKCFIQYASKFGRFNSGHRTGKCQFHSNPKEGQYQRMLKFSSVTQLYLTLCDPMDCSTSGFPVHHQLPELAQTHGHWVGDTIKPSHPLFCPLPPVFNLSQHFRTVVLISQANKFLLKILQASLQQYVNLELTDVPAGFKKGRGTKDQVDNIHWIIDKTRKFHKNSYFCFINYVKAFDYIGITKNWKILWNGNTRPPYLSPERPVCRSRNNS